MVPCSGIQPPAALTPKPCLIGVPAADTLYTAFRAGLCGPYGKAPASGIPRLTRPRKQQDNIVSFAPIDPGGNWLRIDEQARAASTANETTPRKPDRSALATALHAAGIRSDSKDAPQAAANLLDKALPRAESPYLAGLIAALVYRAELAVRLDTQTGAARCVAQMRAIPSMTKRARRYKATSNAPTISGKRA